MSIAPARVIVINGEVDDLAEAQRSIGAKAYGWYIGTIIYYDRISSRAAVQGHCKYVCSGIRNLYG